MLRKVQEEEKPCSHLARDKPVKKERTHIERECREKWPCLSAEKREEEECR